MHHSFVEDKSSACQVCTVLTSKRGFGWTGEYADSMWGMYAEQLCQV